QQFLRSRGSHLTPQVFDPFDLHKQVVIWLPHIPETSKNHCKDVVRAMPPTARSGRRLAQPSHLDFALNILATWLLCSQVMSGLRVAHVKVIFRLLSHFNTNIAQPLAYVEWLTLFLSCAPDSPNGLISLTRSTRMHRPHAEIIALEWIVCSCHLIPHFNRVKEPHWTSENITELYQMFWVNHYIDFHFYAMFVLRRRDCT
ncbi:hypothetical protein BC835DRAFT_1275020, partial [Cytidiella melzeri]